MSKAENNYRIITIVEEPQDFNEIIEYEPENQIVYEYIEIEAQNEHQIGNEILKIHKQEPGEYQAISEENNEDIQLLHIRKEEPISYQSIIRSNIEDKFRCTNRACKKNNVAFDTKIELDDHMLIHAEQFRNSICPICNKVLANQTKLTNHIELRHTPKNFTCDQCGKVFRSKDNLRLHMTHHRKYFYVECRACNRGYKSMQSLRYHLRQHFEHHQCDSCGKVFEHKKLLLGHVAAMHNVELQVQCRFCTRMFARSDVRDAHEREIHKNGIIGSHFRCSQCDCAFDLRDELMSHKILAHFNGVIHTCEECGKNFKKKSLLDLHMSVHRKKQVQCETCKQMFTFITGLNKHKKMGRCKGPPVENLIDSLTKEEIAKIAKQQLMEITVNPKKMSEEEQDSFTFDEYDDMISINKDSSLKKRPGKSKLMVPVEFPEIKTEIKIETGKNKSQRPSQALTIRALTHDEIQEQTIQDFHKKEILKSSSGRIIKRKLPPVITSAYHRPSNVVKKVSSPLICDICGENFEVKSAMITHLNSHLRNKFSNKASPKPQFSHDQPLNYSSLREKKFICDICDKRYLTKHLLCLHKKSHENLKEYKCNKDSCTFETNSPYDLNNHIKRIHNPTRPYKCSECEKMFKRRCDMINHKKSVHSEIKTYVKCPVCETIILEKGLQSHMINRHSEKAQQKPFVCNICGKRERYEKVLQRHYFAVHEPRNRGVIYQCPLCPQFFYRRRDVTAHSFEHYEGEIFECLVCNNKYKTKKELNNHEYTHNLAEFPCPYCEQVFQTKSGRGKHLKKHIDAAHLQANEIEGSNEIEKGASNEEQIVYEEFEMLEENEQDILVI